MASRSTTLALALLPLAFAPPVRADVIVLNPTKDNTLYESATGALSNGAGPTAFAGRSSQPAGSSIRRGLIAFPLGAIPSGSTITSAHLDLHIAMVSSATPRTVELHRVSADWGEGASNAGVPGGSGAPATLLDATWVHRFFPGVAWGSFGGDFAAAASATQSITGVGNHSWGPTAAMVADAQSWLDAPAGNFGWLLRGDESAPGTAVRYDSRESATPAFRPTLTIEYTPGATPTHRTSWGRIKALFR